MYLELLNCTRAECVTGGNEQGEVVLKKKKGEFGKTGGFADAVDTDDGNNIGAGRGGQEVEIRRRIDGRYRAKDIK